MTLDSNSFTHLSCEEFASLLAAKAPVPGGGGAAAYVGALAAALASMVGGFTSGKPRYAAVEKDVQAVLDQATPLRARLLELVDADASAYAKVAAAYKVPKSDPARAGLVEGALKEAAEPPLAIMEACCEVLGLFEELAEKGSRMLLSDVAVGAALAGGALEAASFGVLANTSSLSDAACAGELESRSEAMLAEWLPRGRAVVRKVERFMRGED